jgi:hypothetical protein
MSHNGTRSYQFQSLYLFGGTEANHETPSPDLGPPYFICYRLAGRKVLSGESLLKRHGCLFKILTPTATIIFFYQFRHY